MSDPKKREIYDKYGEEGLNDPKIVGDYDPFDPFNPFCKKKFVKLNITLEDAYNWGRKEIEYDRKIICPKCKGVGSTNPNEKITCIKCNGSGNEWKIGYL